MNIWREDAFFHWKFCKFLTYERTYLPVFCFLCVLHVPFLRGEQVMRNKTEMNELSSSKMFWPCNETVPWNSRKVDMPFVMDAVSFFGKLSKRIKDVSLWEPHKTYREEINGTGINLSPTKIFTCRKQISFRFILLQT